MTALTGLVTHRKALWVASAMTEEDVAVAREAGFRRAIHAIMGLANASAHWSASTGTTLRRYALFGRPLACSATRGS